ncbi:hypothetical protein K3495_g1079 [Podosphaera aphanis]|nr:hypothetical protein K3495_g1079 [Podosphaera aphanis]
MDSSEHAIQCAIKDLNDGVFTSQRKATKKYEVPESTLRGRLAGIRERRISQQYYQRVCPEQEEYLANWILDEVARGCPPTHARTREMAGKILASRGDHNSLGKGWISSFLKRNKKISSVVGRKIDASRASAATPENSNAFFDLFVRTCDRLHVPTEDIWNMDETGIALGVCSNSQVLASPKKIKTYQKSPDNREWVSIIEAVSAAGKKSKCLVIFIGQSLQTSWLPSEAVPNWFYTTSENVWTSNSIGTEWLRRIFIPEVCSNNKNKILILDGHGSHISLDFMLACKENKIHLLYLPPHASHILQPLDLAPFSVVKSKYRAQICALSALNDAAPVKKENFIKFYNLAREEGLSERVIRSGWRATGLVPFNPEKVLRSSQVCRRPSTPPDLGLAQTISDTELPTPKKALDVYQSQQKNRRSENISHRLTSLLKESGQALERSNTRVAELEMEVERLISENEELKSSRPRKKRLDPNERVATVNEIEAAQQQAQTERARNLDLASTRAAREASDAILQSSFESLRSTIQF